MKSIESNLINTVMSGNEKQSLIIYKKLINKHGNVQASGCKLRSFKSYLICINCILYNMCQKDKTSVDEIFEKRNHFIVEIDKKCYFESLYELGREIVLFYARLNKDNYSITTHPVVNQALNFIHNNLDKDLTLEQVAREVHISKSYLCSLFPIHLNSSFSFYMIKVKVEYGKKLLAETHKSLLDIAFECGFNSQSYFCSTFKKTVGMTPLQYKKSLF